MEIKSHKDLDVWKKAVALVKDIYESTAEYPSQEVFGLSAR